MEIGKKYDIQGLVFEGGGVLGTAHVGALTYASRHFDITKVKYFAGTSAGSIIAALCACRISIRFINEIVNEIKFSKLLDDDFGIVRDMNRLWTKFGYHKGNAIEDKLGSILEKYTGNNKITLKEVYDKYGSFIIIPATEMYKHYCVVKYFTPISDPDVELKAVVRYSSSYPFVYTAKNYYSDGGILDNYPIKKLSEYVSLKNILGFKFRSNKSAYERPVNVIEFATAIISGLRKRANVLSEDYMDRTIIINTGNYKSMNFDITENDKKIIYELGKEGAKLFFEMSKSL